MPGVFLAIKPTHDLFFLINKTDALVNETGVNSKINLRHVGFSDRKIRGKPELFLDYRSCSQSLLFSVSVALCRDH